MDSSNTQSTMFDHRRFHFADDLIEKLFDRHLFSLYYCVQSIVHPDIKMESTNSIESDRK